MTPMREDRVTEGGLQAALLDVAARSVDGHYVVSNANDEECQETETAKMKT